MADTLAERYGYPPAVRDPKTPRKRRAHQRMRLLEGEWRDLTNEAVTERYKTEEGRRKIRPFINQVVNVAGDVISAISVAYTAPPRRYLKTGGKALAQEFSDLVEESRAATKAPQWSKHALFVGPCVVAPVVREQLLVLELYPTHRLDIRWGEAGPDGPPESILVRIEGGFMLLDREAWRYFNERGEETKPPVEHFLGYVPAAIFKAYEVSDFWGEHINDSLMDATIDATLAYAEMNYVRHARGGNLLAVESPTGGPPTADESPEGQIMDPEGVIELRGGETMKVLDTQVDPKNFIDQIKFIYERATQRYGIPASEVQFEAIGSELGVAVVSENLHNLRDGQIPYFRESEIHLWRASWDMVAYSDHPSSTRFYTAQEHKRSFVVEFPEMNLVADPLRAEELYEKKVKRGAASPVTQLMLDKPALTETEARAEIRKNLEDTADLNDYLTKRNASADPQQSALTLEQGLQSSEQRTGREGGVASGESRRQDDDD